MLRPIRSPVRQSVGRLLRRCAPVIVWFAAAGGAGWLMFERAGPMDLEAIAEPEIRQIATTATGRLAAVAVEPMQTVRSGQVVAMIDDAAVAGQIETAKAEIAQLRAAIDAERVRLAQDTSKAAASRLDDQRRFETDAETYRSNILELKTQISSDRVQTERLKLQMDRLAALLGERAVSQQEYDNVRLEHDEIARRIEENERLLGQNERNLAAAIERLSRFNTAPALQGDDNEANLVLGPLRLALLVQERRIDELVIERQSLVLRSPVDGWVTQVLRGAGEAVRAGDPIAVVTGDSPARLVAYVDESNAARVSADSEVALIRRTRPPVAVSSRVLQVGPSIEPMPQRLWRAPNLPGYGRPVIIAGAPGWKLLPGEVVGVRLSPLSARIE